MQKKGAYRFASGIAVFAPLFYLALNLILVAC